LTTEAQNFPLNCWQWESLFTGLDYWTLLLDSTTGLDYWTHPRWCRKSSLFQCRSKANHVYSAYFFATFAPLACWANFTGVSRGQRSHAY